MAAVARNNPSPHPANRRAPTVNPWRLRANSIIEMAAVTAPKMAPLEFTANRKSRMVAPLAKAHAMRAVREEAFRICKRINGMISRRKLPKFDGSGKVERGRGMVPPKYE